jgi:hypothetical protein
MHAVYNVLFVFRFWVLMGRFQNYKLEKIMKPNVAHHFDVEIVQWCEIIIFTKDSLQIFFTTDYVRKYITTLDWKRI